ncbi:magnesium/cobalt transporter CorA [Flavobacterium sp. F-65]|uniref:Magnesium transport protein CorA n=1 Tax=Flavobacterium pisciphilum TaxID=2893755 RepID=A0ABS8MZJ2_9FLAO|nr:magnesium/cobalt transporter CorA [Flavobacterium sp. F-65]MCC9074200.1 magnesium/cobalt transporter CorA [Flavobacterium sp. F-65]
MRKIKYKKGRKLQPYYLEYTGQHKDTQSEMQLFVYDDFEVIEYDNFNISALNTCIDYTKNNWLNIHGLNNIDLIKSIGGYFEVDGFMLADILNTSKRTKLQEQQEILFFNIKSLLPSEVSDSISVEQISFIIKDGVLISFQEKRSDFFTHIRERIRQHAGIVRTKKVDYLLYLLLDAVMENFYITLEDEEDKVEELINITKGDTNPIILEKIEKHRDNFNFLKRSIIPLRDSLYDIKSIKDDNTFNGIEKENFSFFARLHQKSLELLEQIESDMSSLESASNFYFSAQSHKMNEIMKTLTIISAIFIPLTFIVGVYGMNFENIPELKYQYGYYSVMIGMFLLVIALIIYFKKRKWF